MLKVEPTGKEAKLQAGNFIYELDNEGYIVYANRAFVNFTGFDKKELIGAFYAEILDPKMPRTLFTCMRTSTANGETWKGYSKNLKSNGDFYWSIAYVSVKPEKDGYIAMYKPVNKSSVDEIAKAYEEIYNLEQEGKDTTGLIKNIIIGE